MNKFFILKFLLAMFIFAIAGCNNEKPDSPIKNERLAVNLIADIKPASTLKVTNDRWEENDKVGLFMKKAGQAITAVGAVYADAANVQMSISEQMFIAETPVLYPASGNVDFVAYYPYTESVGSDYTIAVNVAEQTEALPVEVLYSNNAANQKPTEDPVMLNFQYSLAKLEITVKGGANLTAVDFAAMTASIEGMNTQANLNLADGAFTGKQTKHAITLRKTNYTDTMATFEALVLPTTAADGEITFLFQVGNQTYPYSLTTNYTSGKLYDLHFEIDFTAMNEPKAMLLNASITPRTKIMENYVINAKTQQIDDIQLYDVIDGAILKFLVYTTIAGGMDDYTVEYEYDVDKNFTPIVNILYTQINQADCYCQIPTSISLDNLFEKAVISVKARSRTGGTEEKPEFSDYRLIDSKEIDLPGLNSQIYWIRLKEITDENLIYDVFTNISGGMNEYIVEYEEMENNSINVSILYTQRLLADCYCMIKTNISIKSDTYHRAIITAKVRSNINGSEENPEYSDYSKIDSKEIDLPRSQIF